MGNGDDKKDKDLAKEEARRRKDAMDALNKKVAQGRKLSESGDWRGLHDLSHEMWRDKYLLINNLPGVLGAAFKLWYEGLDLLDHSIDLIGHEAMKDRPSRDVIKELLENVERRKKELEGYLHAH